MSSTKDPGVLDTGAATIAVQEVLAEGRPLIGGTCIHQSGNPGVLMDTGAIILGLTFIEVITKCRSKAGARHRPWYRPAMYHTTR